MLSLQLSVWTSSRGCVVRMHAIISTTNFIKYAFSSALCLDIKSWLRGLHAGQSVFHLLCNIFFHPLVSSSASSVTKTSTRRVLNPSLPHLAFFRCFPPPLQYLLSSPRFIISIQCDQDFHKEGPQLHLTSSGHVHNNNFQQHDDEV